MAIVIENIDELKSMIMRYIENGMTLLAKEMTDDLGHTIETKFYGQYTPSRYLRTFQLLRAVHRPEITIKPSSVEIKVFVDYSSMRHYRYNGTSIGTPTYRGHSFTEEELAESAAQGYHGIKSGYVAAVTSGHFWEDFEKKWNIQRVERTLKKQLIQLGLDVR